jgi:coproporphyrinogen III oxidase-like Fe-S oxidoreductase
MSEIIDAHASPCSHDHSISPFHRRAINSVRQKRRTALDILAAHPQLRFEQDDYNINVTANFGDKIGPRETFDRIVHHDGAGRPAHLYFHVPLCDYICKFCNYVKQLEPGKDRNRNLEKWASLLIGESNHYLHRVPWLSKARIESIYLGGGTAAMLRTADLDAILTHVRQHYTLSRDIEISLEGNPDNFLHGEADRALALGFNRFSLGVQSLQDKVSDFVGRKHSAQQSIAAIRALQATRRPFNVDVMFGLPYQTVANVTADMQALVEMGIPTITIYRFRNAKRSEMGIGNKSAWNDDRLNAKLRHDQLYPRFEETYEMREAVVDCLAGAGYEPSPCGWWSKPGTYTNGNIPQVSKNKWERFETMLAFGPGAYGWITGESRDVVQTHNLTDIAGYMRHCATETTEPLAFGRVLTGVQAVAARLGFAYKANQPIDLQTYERLYDVRLLEDSPYAETMMEMIDAGFLDWCGPGKLRPTPDGETIHEEIITSYFQTRLAGGSSLAVCNRAA